MELTDEGGVKSYSMEAGKVTVIRDTVPTQAIPYTYKVKQTNAAGQFTLVNHFVPSIPESPTSLPVTYKKVSGSLPTTGWTEVTTPNLIWEGTQRVDAKGTKDIYNSSLSFVPTSEMKSDTEPTHWQYKKSDGTWANVQRIYTTDGTHNGLFLIITPNGAAFSGYEFLDGTNFMRIANGYTSVDDFYGIRYVGFTQRTYTISDGDITANTSVKMYLTDEGGTKAQSKTSGSITVIRDSVPTTAIPYEYEVEQTSAEGLFEVINAYVPAVPTKTSELENDSGYVRSVVPPVVQNVVCNDVDSATTLDTTITCEVGDLILAQIIVRSALTLPTGWTLLRTIPAVDPPTNQTLSFAYKRATSTSETLTVTQATAGRIYTNLVRLSNAVSISYIQSCEKTGTGITSILSTKPVTPNMVIWGASSILWNSSSPHGNWSSSPSTLDYYSLPQATKQPRLGTFVDSSGAGERTFTAALASNSSGTAMMCGAVEIVGDEVARKGDIPTKTSELTNDSGFITAADIPSAGAWVIVNDDIPKATITEAGTYQVVVNFDVFDGSSQEIQTASCEIYFDSLHKARGTSSVSYSYSSEPRLSVGTYTPVIISENNGFVLRVESWLYIIENTALNVYSQPTYAKFKYRKIN